MSARKLPVPVFQFEDRIPKEVAGLHFDGLQTYQKEELGVSLRYSGAPMIKADVYLYNLGLADLPTDLQSPEMHRWFEEAVVNLQTLVSQAVYLDFELLRKEILTAPEHESQPLCLWALFKYRQAAGPAVRSSDARVSNLSLRVDRGYIHKTRYTYPADLDPATGIYYFLQFLVEFTQLLNRA